MRLIAILSAILVFFWSPAAADATERRSLTLAYDSNESWPWHLGQETIPATMPGLSLDYIAETGRRLGVDITFVRAPFRRALAMMKEGAVDGVFEASYRPEREEFGVYPPGADGVPDKDLSMFLQSYVFYVRAEEQRFQWDGSQIQGVNGLIGVLRNTSAAADLTGKGYPVFEAPDNIRALEMLAVGRLDVVLLLDNIGTAAFSRRPDLARALRTLSPPYEQKPYFLMFSHRMATEERAFADRFWRELAAVARSDFAKKRLEAYELALDLDRIRAWDGADQPIR
ncbi:MAG: hypothetical protein RLY86_4307 [Pseudomonadota bacterium]|jgi:polar amino acid transport system substrate-binding protein